MITVNDIKFEDSKLQTLSIEYLNEKRGCICNLINLYESGSDKFAYEITNQLTIHQNIETEHSIFIRLKPKAGDTEYSHISYLGILISKLHKTMEFDFGGYFEKKYPRDLIFEELLKLVSI